MGIFDGLFKPNVERLRAKRDVKGLIRALGYGRDKYVQERAAEALGEIGDARAVEPLIAALKDRDWFVEYALAKIGKPAVEPLIVALKDEDKDVRLIAIGALEKIGDARAVEPLAAALEDKDDHVRWKAMWVLGKMGDARAVEPLIAALEDKDYHVRWTAAEFLGNIGDARAVEPLIAALEDENNVVRLRAISALEKTGDARAVVPLIAALEDENKDVRQTAAEALAKIGKPAVEPLAVALKDEDKDVRLRAISTLEKIGDTRAVEPLIAALEDDDKDVRRTAISVLGKMGDARAVEPLIATLEDKDVRLEAILALEKIGDARAVEPLAAVLKDGDKDVRLTAIGALGKTGDARAVEPLIAALEDKEYHVRWSAAEALGQTKGEEQIVEKLKEMITKPIKRDIYFTVSYTLAKLGVVSAIPVLIEFLFETPIEIQSLTEADRLRSKVLEALKGLIPKSNLTEELIILANEAASYRTRDSDPVHINLSPSLEEGASAIRTLCSINNPVSSNILYLVTEKKDIRITLPTCAYTTDFSLYFGVQREIASEELRRRGFKGYDPAAYYRKEV